MLCWAEEMKLGDRNKSSSRKLIRSYEGEVNKPFKKPIKWNDERVDTKKTLSTTDIYNLFSTFLSLFYSRQCQLSPRHWWIVGHDSYIFRLSVDSEGEVMHVPEGGGGNFGQDPKVGTASVHLLTMLDVQNQLEDSIPIIRVKQGF